MHHYLGQPLLAADTWRGLPHLSGGSHQIVSVPASQELRDFTKQLADRAALVRDGQVDPEVDNMLLLTFEGRLAALLNGPVERAKYGESHPSRSRSASSLLGAQATYTWPTSRITKVDSLADKVWTHYCESDRDRGVQLIFCDLLVPNQQSTGVYGVARDKLHQKGIPFTEIAFAQDHRTPKRRAALHAAIRSGEVRVCLGSTALIGLGVNVQDRAVAVHHLDAPWRPDELEQRTLRVQRVGNGHREVSAYIYVTEGSYDPVVWQIVEQKARWASQIRIGTCARDAEDDFGAVVLTAALAKAVATGDRRVLEKVRLEGELRLAEARFASRENSRCVHLRDAERLPAEIAKMEERALLLESAQAGELLYMFPEGLRSARSAREAELLLRSALSEPAPRLVALAGELRITAGRGCIRIDSSPGEVSRIEGGSLSSPGDAVQRSIGNLGQEARSLRQQVSRLSAKLSAAREAVLGAWSGAGEASRLLAAYAEACAATPDRPELADRQVFRLPTLAINAQTSVT